MKLWIHVYLLVETLKKENIIDITKQYITMGGIKRIKKAHEGM